MVRGGKQVKVSEAAVQSQILDMLTALKIFFWRSQPLPVPIRRGNAIVGLRRVPDELRGMPDIMILHEGRFIGVECKSSIGKQSDEQKYWQKQIEEQGGVYVVARSWSDVAIHLPAKMRCL